MPDVTPKPVDPNTIMPLRLRDVLQIKGFCERSGIPEGAALAEMLNAKYDLWMAEQELAQRPAPKPAAAKAPAAPGASPATEASMTVAGHADRLPAPLNRQQRRAAERAAKAKANGAHPPEAPVTVPASD